MRLQPQYPRAAVALPLRLAHTASQQPLWGFLQLGLSSQGCWLVKSCSLVQCPCSGCVLVGSARFATLQGMPEKAKAASPSEGCCMLHLHSTDILCGVFLVLAV